MNFHVMSIYQVEKEHSNEDRLPLTNDPFLYLGLLVPCPSEQLLTHFRRKLRLKGCLLRCRPCQVKTNLASLEFILCKLLLALNVNLKHGSRH